ncbi:hypothetical protein LY474_18785 [Myxococcus stipitatus]|uniref:hypothetical protein n=1 Tax=Myxococcus stipitatus TaxID=83455 RepID=UPI001F37A8D2|nr:hypothetical protein [Myxococcus stipitatus]MCE9669847.1 hypothetical protein [Myxococcus stipitatus]
MALAILGPGSALAGEPVEGPPPIPLIGIDDAGSKILLIDASGTRVLADCEHTEEHRMLGGPEKGQVRQRTEGCRFWSLAVHPPTGRWMVAAGVPGDEQFSRMIRFRLGGRDIATPRTKDGRPMGGTLLVLGNTEGIMGYTPGVLETWNTEERQFAQAPHRFTEDGSRVLVANSNSAINETWSWSFSSTPTGVRVLPRGVTDSAGLHYVPGEHRVLTRHPRGGLRLATMERSATKPWKVGPALRQSRRGVVTPFVLGDTLVYYQEGLGADGRCDEDVAGSYRRVDLKTGEERTWRRQEAWCSNDLLAANQSRRTVYFIEGLVAWKMDPHLYVYSLDDDAVRELPVEYVTRLYDVSRDGRYVALKGSPGLVIHDVDTGNTVHVKGLGDTWAVGFIDPR